MLDTSTLSRDSTTHNKENLSAILPTYKVLIIGDQGIGKTTLIQRYIYGIFKESIESTIGLDFQEKTVQVSPEDKIILTIWDTAGSEKFHSIAQSFFTNCDGIILCFDTTDKKTFENLIGWVNYINDYIEIKENIDDINDKKKGKNEGEDGEEEKEEKEEEEEKDWIDDEQFKPVIILAGTKCDLKEDSIVSMEEVKKFTKILKCEYFETSAKNNNGVDDLFFFMAKELFDKKIAVNPKKGFKLAREIDKYGIEGESNSKIGCC